MPAADGGADGRSEARAQLELLAHAGPGLPAHGEPIEAEGWAERVNRGEVLRARNAVQVTELHERLVAAVLDAVERVAGAQARARVEHLGVERVHEVLDGEQIEAVYLDVTKELTALVVPLVRRFAERVLDHRGRMWICERLWARFFTPQPVFEPNAERFSKRIGFLRGYTPHLDSWFTGATNAFVLWIAVGRVSAGNSMLFYPDWFGRDVPHPDFHRNGHRIPVDLPVGEPMTATLEPGDALIFNGEHLHSSELNITSDTRVSLTVRFSLEPPRYGEGGRWLAYHDTRLLDSPLRKWSAARSMMSPAFARFVLVRRAAYEARKWGHKRLPRLVGDPDAKPSTPKVARTDRRSVDTTELAQLAPGELRAVSGGICVARTSRGLYAFPRYCPHEAADLAVNGFVRGDRIVCGWHNVAYDPDSGAPPCEGLRGLRRIDIERL